MGLKDCFGLLEQEEWDIPSRETLEAIIEELEKKLKHASGSERTKLIYQIANTMVFLSHLAERKKKPKKLNSDGKWVWIPKDE
tara:strand:+ start:7359 stop:7607 length:249 start_codon:yes stop_codon:yes gene_type:complete